MTLVTSLDHFAEEAKQRAPGQAAYLALVDGRVRVTCTSADGAVTICTILLEKMSTVEAQLKKKGCEVRHGEWQSGEACLRNEAVWIGAVAYKSNELRPGLWMEAFPYEPSEAEVIQTFLTELIDQGVVSDIPLEQFVKLAAPNVLILSPQDVAGFVESRTTKA